MKFEERSGYEVLEKPGGGGGEGCLSSFNGVLRLTLAGVTRTKVAGIQERLRVGLCSRMTLKD